MIGSQPTGIHLGGSYLLKAEAARAWLEAQQAKAETTSGDKTGTSTGATGTSTGTGTGTGHGGEGPQPPPIRRFYGKKEIEPAKLVREASDIGNEIVSHLAKLPGARVKVVLEVHAEVESGVPDDIARAVKENARVLKVEHDLD
jgi:hypothetical protein